MRKILSIIFCCVLLALCSACTPPEKSYKILGRCSQDEFISQFNDYSESYPKAKEPDRSGLESGVMAVYYKIDDSTELAITIDDGGCVTSSALRYDMAVDSGDIDGKGLKGSSLDFYTQRLLLASMQNDKALANSFIKKIDFYGSISENETKNYRNYYDDTFSVFWSFGENYLSASVMLSNYDY